MAVNEDFLLFLHSFLYISENFVEQYRPLYLMELNGLLWGTSHFFEAHDPENVAQLSSGQLYLLLDLLKTEKAFDSLPCKISFTARGLLDIKEHLAWSEKMLERRPEKQKALQERHKQLLENIREGTMKLTYKELYSLSYVVSHARSRRGQQIEEITNETKRDDTRSAFLYCGFPIDLLLFENRETLVPFFRSYLDSYLEAFREGRVHWPQNVLTWKRQEQQVLHVLHPMQERFGERFSVSHEDFGVDDQWIEGLKPVETLLTLVCLDRIGISSVRMNDMGTLDLCILMREQQAKPTLVQIPPLPASENLSEDTVPMAPPKKMLGRPPKIQYLLGNICDANKTQIIPEKMTMLVALCSTILRLTDDKDRGKWRIEIDTLYEEHQQKPEGTWMSLGKVRQEKFKKFIRNHIPRINGFFRDKGHSEWLGKDAMSVTRQY